MPSHLLLGALTGVSVFLGFLTLRWANAPERLRGILVMFSTGILLFLVMETGNRSIEFLITPVKSGDFNEFWLLGCMFVVGLAVGLLGYVLIEALQSQKSRKVEQAKSKKSSSANSREIPNPMKVVSLIAVGIGLYNFVEALAMGRVFSGQAIALGFLPIAAVVLKSVIQGFCMAALMNGRSISWNRLIWLGLIAGGPSVFGAWLAGAGMNSVVEMLLLSMALGVLIYSLRELLSLHLTSVSAIAGLSTLMLGLVLGLGTETVMNVAQADYTAQASRLSMKRSLLLSFLQYRQAVPQTISAKQGQVLIMENQTPTTLIFEGNGLFIGKVAVPPKDQIPVVITGRAGDYRLMDEYNRSAVVSIRVQAGNIGVAFSAEVNAVAALTMLEGHLRVAKILHQRAGLKFRTDPALDLKRANIHAEHPRKKWLKGSQPDALMLQELLRKQSQVEVLDQAIEAYIEVSGNKDVSEAEVEQKYQAVLNTIDQARHRIAGAAYSTQGFRRKVAQVVLDTAASEYTAAIEEGQIRVKEPAVPGKDGYFEYQNTLGFLWATHSLLFPSEESTYYAPLSVDEKLGHLIEKTFSRVDPLNPKHPVLANQIQKTIGAIEEDMLYSNQTVF